MITIVTAAGTNKRWRTYKESHHPDFKQLVLINGEPLISRIHRQLRERNTRHYIVIADEEIADKSKISCIVLKQRRSTLAGTILAVKHLWSFPMTILLGDVVFAEIDLDNIYTSRDRPAAFFGRTHETYAAVFRENPAKMLKVVSEWPGGKLRDMRYYIRYRDPKPAHISERDDRRADPNYFRIKGWTKDIDHKRNLNNLLNDSGFRKEVIEGQKPARGKSILLTLNISTGGNT